MMTTKEWMEWLETIPDEDIEGFEETAHKFAYKYTEETGDVTARQCLTSFFGENPREWIEEAEEMISHNCKTEHEARILLQRLYKEVMQMLEENRG